MKLKKLKLMTLLSGLLASCTVSPTSSSGLPFTFDEHTTITIGDYGPFGTYTEINQKYNPNIGLINYTEKDSNIEISKDGNILNLTRTFKNKVYHQDGYSYFTYTTYSLKDPVTVKGGDVPNGFETSTVYLVNEHTAAETPERIEITKYTYKFDISEAVWDITFKEINNYHMAIPKQTETKNVFSPVKLSDSDSPILCIKNTDCLTVGTWQEQFSKRYTLKEGSLSSGDAYIGYMHERTLITTQAQDAYYESYTETIVSLSSVKLISKVTYSQRTEVIE